MSGKVVSVAILGLVVLGAAGWGFTRFQARAKAKPEEIGRTVVSRQGDITIKVSETGTLDPVLKVDVKSRVAGRLLKIFVKAGDTIRAGAPIALVDPTEVSRDVATAQAQLRASQAGLMQSQQNYGLSQKTTALAIQRAAVNLENAKVGLKDAAVSLKDAEVGLRNAELGVEQARKRLSQSAAPTRSQEVEQAQQSIRRIQAQLVDAKRTLARRKLLLEKGFIAQQEVDAAQTQIDLAEVDLLSAQERVALLKEGPRKVDIETTQVGVDAALIQVDQAGIRIEQTKVRYEQAQVAVKTARLQLETERANAQQAQVRARDIDRSRADVAQVENRLAQQSVQLSETRIVAPISGEVTGKYLEQGELVASATAGFAQGAALVTIADLSKMQVKVNVNEVDVARLSLGLPVEIKVDGIPETVFHGKVVALAPASLTSSQAGPSNAANSGNAIVRFEVKIAVIERDRRLRPGMTATVDILLSRKQKIIVLPTEALRPGNQVMVVTGKDATLKKEARTVVIGLRDDAHLEIVSGLRAGEAVEVPKIDAKDRRKINVAGPNN